MKDEAAEGSHPSYSRDRDATLAGSLYDRDLTVSAAAKVIAENEEKTFLEGSAQ